MNEEYFEWLLSKAGVDEGDQGYRLLCSILHDTPFYPILEMDENRWEDGIAYRFSFTCDEQKAYDISKDIGGCTMMELLLSLSEKTAFDMQESLYEAGVGKWFYELLENLGLDIYTDERIMNDESAYHEISGILERVIFRQYSRDGFGGLYPLNDWPDEDQTKVEIEIQRNLYLMENYM